jgi:hypothetical protein
MNSQKTCCSQNQFRGGLYFGFGLVGESTLSEYSEKRENSRLESGLKNRLTGEKLHGIPISELGTG